MSWEGIHRLENRYFVGSSGWYVRKNLWGRVMKGLNAGSRYLV